MWLTQRGRWMVGGGALITAAAALLLLSLHHAATATVSPAQMALPHNVTVEVLNTTRTSGIARVARDVIRHAGLDVVYFGSADTTLRARARSEVLVRRGDTTGVGRILQVIGPATVTDAPDRAREVDLTVLIGADYLQAKPPGRP